MRASWSSYYNPWVMRRLLGDGRSRRIHVRVPCDLPTAVWSDDQRRRLGRGRFLNLGMGGGFLEIALVLERDSFYRFEVAGARALGPLRGRVARLHKASSPQAYGVSFTLSPAQDKLLKAWVSKSSETKKAPPVENRKLKWYWWY